MPRASTDGYFPTECSSSLFPITIHSLHILASSGYFGSVLLGLSSTINMNKLPFITFLFGLISSYVGKWFRKLVIKNQGIMKKRYYKLIYSLDTLSRLQKQLKKLRRSILSFLCGLRTLMVTGVLWQGWFMEKRRHYKGHTLLNNH